VESLHLYLHRDSRFSNVFKFYRNIKNQRRSDLLNEIVKIGTWRLSDCLTGTNIEPKDTIFKYLPSDSVSQNLEKIYIELKSSKSRLTLCALSIEPFGGRSPYTILSSFSYWIAGKQPEAHRAIQTILLSLLIDTCGRGLEREGNHFECSLAQADEHTPSSAVSSINARHDSHVSARPRNDHCPPILARLR
jgi:hypothetical protein